MAVSSCEVQRMFIGAGCNRIVNNVSWGACGLVAFGAQNAVAIFCPEKAQILTTFPGHKASVNCTRWLPGSKFTFRAKHLAQHFLLSGDADGAIILWELSLLERKWRHVLDVPQPHKKGVTCIVGIMVSLEKAICASTSSDGSVCIWEISLPSTVGGDCKFSCIQSFSVGSKSMVALSLAELPGNPGHMILAMGGLDNKIHLYSGETTGKFVRACELKGHSDWIRSLDFSLPICENGQENTLLLVSSSQDKGIRIWKLVLRDALDDSERKRLISLASYIEGPVLVAGSASYHISLESLLIGHEDWVYSVEWQPPLFVSADSTGYYQPQSLLSASMDKTMMIWQPEKTTGIWMNVVTVGELSHCALGFYGGHWSPAGDAILAHGYGGSFHLWRNVGVDYDDWKPHKVPSGHHAVVSDIAWAKTGEFLMSVSHDQTTRIFASWSDEDCPKDEYSWHEIARPQVHGHDINCVTVVQGKRSHRFVSGAEEKVARVFEAPLSFLKTLSYATSQNSNILEGIPDDVHVLGANMSALGLSQKPIYVHATHETLDKNSNDGLDTLESIPDAIPVTLTEPPIEEQLAWHTLWPESHKLYGHGNELFSLCCDHEGKLVASSCKAQTVSVAEIWLWLVGSWKAVGRLQSHSLTVTQMEFSHDDNFLLAVSRDRHFSVFTIKRTGSDEISHELIARQEAHKRIIWACCWNPCANEFATGSRDKMVKIWAVDGGGTSVKQLLTLPTFRSGVTALSWLGLDQRVSHGLLAVGMEHGLIELWSLSRGKTEDDAAAVPGLKAALVSRLDPFMCHASTVQRLAWRSPQKREDDSRSIQLASCGADHCVRVFAINELC
ncbi:Elongator subunit elp2 [Dionaea muscipula]